MVIFVNVPEMIGVDPSNAGVDISDWGNRRYH